MLSDLNKPHIHDGYDVVHYPGNVVIATVICT
jgi:hypothetical protein